MWCEDDTFPLGLAELMLFKTLTSEAPDSSHQVAIGIFNESKIMPILAEARRELGKILQIKRRWDVDRLYTYEERMNENTPKHILVCRLSLNFPTPIELSRAIFLNEREVIQYPMTPSFADKKLWVVEKSSSEF